MPGVDGRVGKQGWDIKGQNGVISQGDWIDSQTYRIISPYISNSLLSILSAMSYNRLFGLSYSIIIIFRHKTPVTYFIVTNYSVCTNHYPIYFFMPLLLRAVFILCSEVYIQQILNTREFQRTIESSILREINGSCLRENS